MKAITQKPRDTSYKKKAGTVVAALRQRLLAQNERRVGMR